MGIEGLWLKKKKVHTPAIRLRQTILSSPSTFEASSLASGPETISADDIPAEEKPHIRVDLVGGTYPTIVWAYSNRPLQVAHEHVMREILQLGARELIVVYVGGERAMEKSETHTERDAVSTLSISKTQTNIDQMEIHLADGKKITKSQLQTTTKALRASFKWGQEARDSFIVHPRQQQVEVVLCPAEADLKVAQDCGLRDSVVTRDSHLLAYASVHTIWRLMGRGRVLVYTIYDILTTLGLSRDQFMALCVVSKSDYAMNVHGLAIQFNSKIIKGLSAFKCQKTHLSFSFSGLMRAWIRLHPTTL